MSGETARGVSIYLFKMFICLLYYAPLVNFTCLVLPRRFMNSREFTLKCFEAELELSSKLN